MIPEVGNTVTVTTRYAKRSVWHDNDYEDFVLTGKVIAKPKWLTAEQFAISNPAHPNGFSVINIAKVIDLKDATGSAVTIKLPSDDYKEWTMTGSKGNSYLVIRTRGQYNCTCPGFTYRKHCKHIEEASHAQ